MTSILEGIHLSRICITRKIVNSPVLLTAIKIARDEQCSTAQIEPLRVNNYDGIKSLKRLEGEKQNSSVESDFCNYSGVTMPLLFFISF